MNLAFCDLRPVDVEEIAAALTENVVATSIDLQQNKNLGDAGVQPLLLLLSNPKKMPELRGRIEQRHVNNDARVQSLPVHAHACTHTCTCTYASHFTHKPCRT